MASAYKSRIPSLASSAKSNKSSNFSSTGFDSTFSSIKYRGLSNTSSSHVDRSRFGQYSTQSTKRGSSSVFKVNKYSNCYSASVRKSSKGLFGPSPKASRPSLHHGFQSATSGRRSSVGGDKTRQKDTRQLSDVKYQTTCTAKLIQYLTENGYHSPIPPKFLKSPSKQDVIKVFEFLFSKFDSNLTFCITPIETKVPELMTMLGYPYSMNKSSLTSFSSRSGMGVLLGMFEFLVDNARYLDAYDPEQAVLPASYEDVDVKGEILRAIVEPSEEDPHTLIGELVARKFGTKDVLRDLGKELDELKENEAKLDEEIEEKQQIPQTLKDYQKNLEEFYSFNEYMEGYISKAKEEIAKFEKELEGRNLERIMLMKKREQTMSLLKEQKYDPAEMELARERLRQVEKEIAEECKSVKQLKYSLSQVNLDISNLEDQLRKVYSEFTSHVNSLRMNLNVPCVIAHKKSSIEYLTGDKIDALLDLLTKHETLGDDGEVRRKFLDLIDGFNQAQVEAVANLRGKATVTYQQKINQLDLLLSEKEREIKDLKASLDKNDKDLQSYREKCAEESRHLNDRFQALEKELTEEEKKNAKKSIDRLPSLRLELAQESQLSQEQRCGWNTEVKSMLDQEKKLLENLESALIGFIDTERKIVDTLREEITAEVVILEKIKKKDEKNRMKMKEKSGKEENTTDERSELQENFKENLSVN